MNKQIRTLLFFCISIIIVSCNQGNEQSEPPVGEDTPRVVKKRREDGTLSSLNPVDSAGYLNGVKINFYEDGVAVHSKITYVHGRKHGPAIWFFKSGKIYEYANYYQNRKNGVTKRYYETGELYEEVTFDAGEELPGKKTYDKKGNLINN
jgi:antitoxin component YwqK of YwqJK toxin-antitoxin module